MQLRVDLQQNNGTGMHTTDTLQGKRQLHMITSSAHGTRCEQSVPSIDMDVCQSSASLTSATSFPSSTFCKAILQMIANQYMCRTTSIRSSPLNSMYMSGLKPSTCSTSKLQHSIQLQLTRAISLVSCYIYQNPKQLEY